MKITSFRDFYGQEITISYSGGGDYIVAFPSEKDSSRSVVLNKYQANILINALKDFMEDEGD